MSDGTSINVGRSARVSDAQVVALEAAERQRLCLAGRATWIFQPSAQVSRPTVKALEKRRLLDVDWQAVEDLSSAYSGRSHRPTLTDAGRAALAQARGQEDSPA